MKKIPTLFKREFDHHRVTGIVPELTDESLAWVLSEDPAGNGAATVKIDGSCCAVIGGVFYLRYDARRGKNGIMKTPPPDAIPCDDPDPVTGHWPHWAPAKETDPGAKWYIAAKKNAETAGALADGTYEAVGPHFCRNPYGLEADTLVRHGTHVVEVERTFDGIRKYLEGHNIEGLVFWKDGKPRCKIKRKDFGFKWPDGPAEL